MSDAVRRSRRKYAFAIMVGVIGPAYADDTQVGAAANPLSTIPKESLNAFRTRPLFAPTRAEAPVIEATPLPIAVSPVPPPEPPQLKLVGIIGGRAKFAVIRLEGAKARIVGTGDKVQAWTVTVLDTSLRLDSDSRTVEIVLFKAAPAAMERRLPRSSVSVVPSGPSP